MNTLLAVTLAAFAALPHSADTVQDGHIDLSELLRVVQIYNSSEYHCDATGEDGFGVGAGLHNCSPHSSDYAAQDWAVSLSELLRLIQFYNADGYHESSSTEDGFGPGRDIGFFYWGRVRAADDTFLGYTVGGNGYERLVDGPVYDPGSVYGDTSSELSAYNPSATTPPQILDALGGFMAWVTVNRSLSPRVEPDSILEYVGG